MRKPRALFFLSVILVLSIWLVGQRRETPSAKKSPSTEAGSLRTAAVVVREKSPLGPKDESSVSAKLPVASAPRNEIFAYVARPPQADKWEASLATPTKQINYVRIDQEAAVGKHSPFWKTGNGGHIDLLLPDGRTLPVTLTRTEQRGVEGFVSQGGIDGEAYGRAIFAYRDGEMSATIEEAPGISWQLRARGEGISQFFKVDVSQVPPCGVDSASEDPQAKNLIARRAAAAAQILSQQQRVASDAGPKVFPTPANATGANIKILFLYTDAVAATASSSAIGTQADLAISILNDDLARSNIDATATLAGSVQVSYDETTSAADKVQSEALQRLADPADGYIDNIHALRDQYGADLVSLALNRQDSSSAGIAYILGTPGNADNSSIGFSVVQYSVMDIQSVFSHEIGHNLGCAHDREHAKDSAGNASPGAYSYSYGYRFTGADGVVYHTIMSYDPGTRLSYFSNPDITAPAPISKPLGIPAGQALEADNARTIRQDEVEVSNFRNDTIPGNGNAGTLVNVSTRAFVGTGAQQLIGGFIITGSSSKKVLVRAIGPTLAQYSVSGALLDPTLRLVRQSDGVQLDSNDNWGTGPNAATVAAAFTQSGAFALPAGSRDSAIVATLSPGNYTANIEGVGGTTGIALIEAYELDKTGSRLANLSTRGFADKDRNMIGGFIVQADPSKPGQTKKILIRVLGPSLANYGVTGAMDDPTFSLHDSTTAQILQDDDWSTTDSVAGDDTKPSAVSYSAQQIAATGLAPGNRRDSAVLVDLKPGGYTAVVQPFEKLPDEVQKPGVALVEVYEILP